MVVVEDIQDVPVQESREVSITSDNNDDIILIFSPDKIRHALLKNV
jgi:hypothetical protein